MEKTNIVFTGVTALVMVIVMAMMLVVPFASAASITNPQQFEVYDSTNDGLVVATDADIGNVQAVANPGGAERVIIQASLKKVAPNCTYTVELVRGSAATNGGLSASAHTGSITVLGTLTTNGTGNGNAHFDFAPSGDGVADTAAYGHLDFEDRSGACAESDGTTVSSNEYGAAPDPTLATPFTWMQ